MRWGSLWMVTGEMEKSGRLFSCGAPVSMPVVFGEAILEPSMAAGIQ